MQQYIVCCVLGPEQFVRTHSEYSMVDVIIIVALLADPRCYMEFGKLFTWVSNPNNHTIFPNLFNTSALVTTYLNKIRIVITSFQSWSPSDSVAKWITRKTSDREVFSSNSPGGECFYNSKKSMSPPDFVLGSSAWKSGILTT